MAKKATICQLAWINHLPNAGMRIPPTGYMTTNTSIMMIPCAQGSVFDEPPPPPPPVTTGGFEPPPLPLPLPLLLFVSPPTNGFESLLMLACAKSTSNCSLSSCLVMLASISVESRGSPSCHAEIQLLLPSSFRLEQSRQRMFATIVSFSIPDPSRSSNERCEY